MDWNFRLTGYTTGSDVGGASHVQTHSGFNFHSAFIIYKSYAGSCPILQEVRHARELAMIFSLMIRFLFMFYDELHRIMHAQKARCFDAFNKKIPYKWRMKQLGYTVAMMFLRAYEQGETIYMSMASRGFSDESNLYHDRKKKLGRTEYIYIGVTLLIVIGLQILAMTHFYELGVLGMNII